MRLDHRLLERAALLLFAVVALVIVLTFRDYGIAWDEAEAQEYGQLILDYYRTDGVEARALTFNNMFYYGGLFEATAAWLGEHLPLAPFDTRHLLNALIGLLGIVGTWKLGKALGGPLAGLLAAVLLLAVPSYYGHMYINSKDIPFAAASVWALYYTVLALRAMPRPPVTLALKLGLAAGLGLGVRVGAVLIVVNLVAAVAGWLVLQGLRREGWRPLARDAGRIVLRLLPGGILAYAVMIALWPWAQIDPLVRPLEALNYFSRFPYDIPQIIDGQLFRSSSPPWYYLPVFFGVKLPEIVLLTSVAATFAGLWTLADLSRRRSVAVATLQGAPLEWGLLAFAFLFPVVYATVSDATLYDEMRHFLFVVPVVAVAGGCWLARVVERSLRWRPALRAALVGIAGMYLTVHVAVVAALHPNQYVYYNALVGGVDGAEGKFDLDYWDNSLRELAEQLTEHAVELYGERARTLPMRLRICGHAPSILPFLPAAWRVTPTTEIADFYIAHTRFVCGDPVNGPVVAKVERLGSELSYAVDLRQGLLNGNRIGALAAPPSRTF
ncbi:MAG: glycosyltransferase family 39 protein [Gammaproteobacteria bacterium]|jgi:hypothetical protein|nr:glycosyltransferase family 39 protein [Gammaproteobacteria bacterium]